MKRISKIGVILLLALTAVFAAGCDDSGTGSYDYYDRSGKGYNDDDVNWDGGGKGDKQKGWDDAVNDWNRANGY